MVPYMSECDRQAARYADFGGSPATAGAPEHRFFSVRATHLKRARGRLSHRAGSRAARRFFAPLQTVPWPPHRRRRKTRRGACCPKTRASRGPSPTVWWPAAEHTRKRPGAPPNGFTEGGTIRIIITRAMRKPKIIKSAETSSTFEAPSRGQKTASTRGTRLRMWPPEPSAPQKKQY